MQIELIDIEGNFICDFDLPSNPFKLGERINLDIKNLNKKLWKIDDINGTYIIKGIEHFVRKHFCINGTVSFHSTISILVQIKE